MALIDKQTALDALMAKRERLLDHGQAGAEHILTHCGYNVIDELPTVPAIPLAWIDSYIQTCEIFDLRANAPASKVIKTMVKIWEQENQITTMVKNMGTGNPEPWKGENDGQNDRVAL